MPTSQGEIDYFTANQQRMDYRRYRKLGLPIGSGTVESACKNVVAARLKQSGMMWGMPGATGMLQLRASLKSRRFRSDHERLLPFSPPQETETHGLPDPSTLAECTQLRAAACRVRGRRVRVGTRR